MQRSITPTPDQARSRRGFTIVELLVVIAVIGILATVSIVSYGAWKKSAATAQVKSDLNGVVAAMESARTFNNAYPTALPSTMTASDGVSLTGGSADGGKTYCIDGASTADATIVYYVDSTASDKGAQAGTCATRPNLPGPGIPSNLAIVSSTGTQVNLSRSAATNAANYTAQCASDAAFIVGMKEATQPGTSASISGLTMSSSFYCRVKAVNNTGSSAWSASVSTATTNAYGSLAVASSIEGYWTNAPQGFLLEDGSAVSRTTYADLFAVIGTTYGAGDGFMTFNLPDSRGRTSVNRNVSDVEFATIGQITGSKTETLTIAQMPSHTHIQNPHNHIQNPHSHTITFGGMQPQHTNTSVNDGTAANRFHFANGTNDLIAAPTTATNQPTTATNQNTGGGGSHNNIEPSIVSLSAIKYTPAISTGAFIITATSIEGYWTASPQGFLLEDGSAVSRTTYADLFAVVGITYGAGDGSTTFNLPDSRGRAAVNKSPSDTEFDTMGEKPGSKTETLTIAQMPSHTHIQNPHNHIQNPHAHTITFGGMQPQHTNTSVNDGTAANRWHFANGTNDLIAAPTTATNQPTTATNQNTGGSGSHNNIQPSIVKLFVIKY